MNDTAKKRAEADLALAALDERVARLEEEAGQRIADVEGISATNTAALVAGKAPDEKKLEAALEERDRAVRRLEAARAARAQAEALAEEATRKDEAARAAATLEAENVLAREIKRDLRREILGLGPTIRAAIENDRRAQAARSVLQSHGGDGPVESIYVFGAPFAALLDEVARELQVKRGGAVCDRFPLALPY